MASLAYNTDVGSEPYYLPLITATRMLLPEADYISQPYLSNHWLSRSIARPVLVYLFAQFCSNQSGSFVEVLTG
jgi:hypothetical protein